MSYRGVELAVGEWFHCYSRTIDRSRIFRERTSVERFLETLYLANQVASLPSIPRLHRTYSHEEVFSIERMSPLVAIGAYSIMPTHYHLLVQPLVVDGLSRFMHKVGTGFTRFYNERHERIGNLFVKPFRSRHVSSDGYFFHIPNYIHLNAAELFEPGWKEGRVHDIRSLEKRLREYAYSSLSDYEGALRPQRSILNDEAILLFREHLPPLRVVLSEAREYFQFLDLDV